MTPAAVVYEHLRTDAAIAELTVAHWIGAARATEHAFTIIGLSESIGLSTIDGLGDTQAQISISSCSSEYEAAWRLAELVRLRMHGQTLTDARYRLSAITFSSLNQAEISGSGQQTIFVIPQVFTCYLRRL